LGRASAWAELENNISLGRVGEQHQFEVFIIIIIVVHCCYIVSFYYAEYVIHYHGAHFYIMLNNELLLC
jgi:hypothetical protein